MKYGIKVGAMTVLLSLLALVGVASAAAVPVVSVNACDQRVDSV